MDQCHIIAEATGSSPVPPTTALVYITKNFLWEISLKPYWVLKENVV
jgi:hypothetical protein